MKCTNCGMKKCCGEKYVYELQNLSEIANHQANMETLWSIAIDGKLTFIEDMLQSALRHIHAVIEHDEITAKKAKEKYWDLESEI